MGRGLIIYQIKILFLCISQTNMKPFPGGYGGCPPEAFSLPTVVESILLTLEDGE